MKFKTEASVLDRLRRWRELFGEPMANGRNNPDNDMWFLFLDAEECIVGLRRYARSLEKALEWYAGDGSTYEGIDIGQRARRALIAHDNPTHQTPSTMNETQGKAGTDSE